MKWSDRTVRSVANLAGVIAEEPAGGGRGLRALEGLSKLFPIDRGLLCRTDGDSLVAVAAIGYGRPIAQAVGHREYRLEQKRLKMDTSARPMRFSDLADGGRRSYTVAELAWPAGLRDGIGMSIHSANGRTVGHVAFNATRAGTFTDEHVELLALLDGLLSAAIGNSNPASTSARFGITPREVQILDLIAQGSSNRRIAQILGISESTVRRHVEHVLAKLEVSSRTAAAIKAMKIGLLR